MKARWLKRDNNGVDEKFYPITHVDAIVMGEDDKPMGEHFKDTNNPHKVTAEQVGALPNTGGKLSGDITLQKFDNGKATIEKGHTANNDYGTQIYDYDKDGNVFAFLIRANVALDSKVRVSDGASYYKLFGEHNKALLASTVENLMANGGMSTLQSAIQVTNAVLIGSSTAFTGTGKGKLFLTGGNESIVAEIVIDGKTLNTVKFANTNTTIELEFLKSFSVKNTSNGYYIYANAVFY